MSATYIVRLEKNKELVGIYWAENIDMLAMLIDEDIVDPSVCEIKKLKNGGIYWGRINVCVPVAKDDWYNEEGEEDPIGDAIKKLPVPDFSWSFYDDLTSSKGWRSIKDIWDGKSLYGY